MKKGDKMKGAIMALPKLKVLDIPEGHTAAEIEAKLNEPCDLGYYLDRWFFTPPSVPEGVAVRAYYKLRMRV